MWRWIAWTWAVAMALAGCAAEPQTAETQAAYLVPETGAALTADDLDAHPEVAVVGDMDALKASGAPALWIDGACLDAADGAWLSSLQDVPVAVAGYGDGVYAFAERLGFPIEAPMSASGDPEKAGFCVWVKWADGASMRGFDELTAQAVLDACDRMRQAE